MVSYICKEHAYLLQKSLRKMDDMIQTYAKPTQWMKKKKLRNIEEFPIELLQVIQTKN